MKYVLVTGGGFITKLGIGLTASSIGALLEACGLRVTSIKIDPYRNMVGGTMSPLEHGEVVLDDGGEVDLDIKKIFQSVLDKERKGDYAGQTVQFVPHMTDAIQEWIERVAQIPLDGNEGPADVCLIQLGGTIEDFESMIFTEALGQFSNNLGPRNFCLVHVSVVSLLMVVGRQKTKATELSVRMLRRAGLTPNILACCSKEALEDETKEELSQFCHVPVENVVTLLDVSTIRQFTLLLRDQKAHEAILNELNLIGVVGEELHL